MKRGLLVALAACLAGGLAYLVQVVLEVRAATAPPSPEAFVQATWIIYRLAPGHRAHVGEQGLPCSDCHAPSKNEQFNEPSLAVCLKCHDEQPSMRHTQVALDPDTQLPDGGAREMTDCLACHAFGPDPTQKADDCQTCHAQPQAGLSAVAIHATEQCTSCHDMHQNRVAPIACTECHQVQTSHGTHARGSAEQCLDCHGAHARAESARQSCAGCHQAPDSKVSVPHSATVGEHTCLGCHTPHDFAKNETKSCSDCHEKKAALAGAGHRECGACHQPHDVRGSVEGRNVCATCHASLTPRHAASDGTSQTCTGCHAAHPARGVQGPAACTSCHADIAKGEHAAHAPGMACVGCHQPHDFKQPLESAAVCSECHKPRITQLAKTGHEQCESCHQALPHGGMGGELSCASCHEQGAQVHAGHKTCTSCHDAHTGARPAALCASCHADEQAKLSRKHGPCQSCHEPHVATATPAIASCTGCHTVAKLPALHRITEHHTRCQSCHEAHPEQPPSSAQTCRSCHQDRADHQPEATQCSGCHPFEAPPVRRGP